MSEAASPPHLMTAWQADLDVVLCERCQWRFLAPSGSPLDKCPHCHLAGLTTLPEGLPEMPHPYPPELVVPFGLPDQDLRAAVERFAKDIPYAPADLNSQALQTRLTPVYLPMWLVDASLSATWQAETGFDYQVVSHQEYYNQDRSGWKTREIKEDRIRWENRVGLIKRSYMNITAPALEEDPRLRKSLGEYQQAKALPYQPEHLAQSYVRLPDLPPQEAWKEAVPSFQKAAADEVRQACEAGHLRQFRWKASFSQINWTLMLLPVYTSYYLDDAGQPQPVLIHGQTGSTTGARRASMRQALHASLTLLLIGIILFLTGLILDSFAGSSFLVVISTLITLAGIAFGVGSVVPYATAWDFNRKQTLQSLEVQNR